MRNFTLYCVVIIYSVYFLNQTAHAQIIIGKPNIGFTQACASPSFNSYNVTFSFSPEAALKSNNQFIVELSDGTGSFSNATAVYTSEAGTVNKSPVTFSFSVPTTASGEAYRIRIQSTAPNSISSSSKSFPAYYKVQDTPFSINNLIETGVYCSGGSYLLTIDNPGSESNDSPLKYDSLTFKWYKETSPTTSVFVGDGKVLAVNSDGTYFAKTNYGTCTSNSFSNHVTITEANSNSVSHINSSLGDTFCKAEGPTILSAINANGYQWYKDDVAIEGATKQMYEANESGKYSVNIDLGSCMTSASLNIDTLDFSSSINVEDIVDLNEGETVTVEAMTTAEAPNFKWYLNNEIINNANSNSYEVAQTGNYKVVITQTQNCTTSSEHTFVVESAFPNVENIPNLISPNGDGTNDTWVIPKEYVGGTNTDITIVSSQGKTVFQTKNYQNNWPENQLDFKAVNPVYYYFIKTPDGKTKQGSITVIK